MKADELKIYCVRTDYLGITDIKDFAVNVVLKSDVDEAIAELKAKLNESEYFCNSFKDKVKKLKAENKLLKEHILNGGMSRITWIDKALDLIKENEELKQKLHDAEAAETERKIDYDNLKKNLAESAKKCRAKADTFKEAK